MTFCQTNKYPHYFLSSIPSIYSQIHLHLNPSSSDSFIFCENSIIVALNQTMLNLPNSYPLTYSFANISNLFIQFSIQIFLVLFDPHPSHRHVSKLKSIRETREVLSLIPFFLGILYSDFYFFSQTTFVYLPYNIFHLPGKPVLSTSLIT